MAGISHLATPRNHADMTQKLLSEPVLITAAVEAFILAAVAFGLDWTGEQVASFMIAITAVLALVVRTLVTPVADPNL